MINNKPTVWVSCAHNYDYIQYLVAASFHFDGIYNV